MFLRVPVLIVAAILLVALGAWAQAPFSQQPVNPPIVLSGDDVGFQITARAGNTPVGSVVVRIDGQWVPVQAPSGPSRLTAR